ncbi:geminin-like [Ornithodoros turicata]|uniref:geminin-like n=1 Tax=Ornithodoros turicata TaxID=34597 RepID=UPI0031391302
MKTESTCTTRKTLGNIQTSMLSQSRLVGTNGTISVEKNRKRKFNLDAENAMSLLKKGDSVTASQHTQTISEEAYNLMVKDEVPAKYWKDLAEQRCQALEDALKENEQLHEQLELLKAENEHLQKLVDQTLPLAELFRSLQDCSSKEV